MSGGDLRQHVRPGDDLTAPAGAANLLRSTRQLPHYTRCPCRRSGDHVVGARTAYNVAG